MNRGTATRTPSSEHYFDKLEYEEGDAALEALEPALQAIFKEKEARRQHLERVAMERLEAQARQFRD